MSRAPLDPAPSIRIGGSAVESVTLVGGIGPYVLTLSTVVPSLAVELHSTYVGHRDVDTQVVHLLLLPGADSQSHNESRSHDALPVVHARRLCLYDHLAKVREVLAEFVEDAVKIDVLDKALELLEAPPAAAG